VWWLNPSAVRAALSFSPFPQARTFCPAPFPPAGVQGAVLDGPGINLIGNAVVAPDAA